MSKTTRQKAALARLEATYEKFKAAKEDKKLQLMVVTIED